MTQADAAFTIGKTHKICQDYAAAQASAVVLCDGCSSSPDTDIGARLLARQMLARRWDFEAVVAGEEAQQRLSALVRAAVTRAASGASDLGLPPDCLDATLLCLVATSDAVHVAAYGDGAVVFGFDDGTRTVYRSRYAGGYPFYPVYLADAARRARWGFVAGNAHTVTKTVLDADGAVRSQESYSGEVSLLRVPLDGLRFAAVLSDGIESFQTRAGASGGSVDYLAAVHELTAFKNFGGAFVHRRMQAWGRECAKAGVFHNDDVSVAALAFVGAGEEYGD